MEKYEHQYEKYKNSLLKSWYFKDKLKEKYENTLYAEKNFIDINGVLWKVGILSGVCGVCFGIWSILGEKDSNASIIWRIVLAVVGIVCFVGTMYIASKYKKASGKTNFYSFVYRQYVKDHVYKEQQKNADKLMRDMLEQLDNILWRAELIEENCDEEQLLSNLLYVIKISNDFSSRYKTIAMYDRFAKDMLEDYYFDQTVHEFLK